MAETGIDVKLDPRPATAGSEEVVAALRAMVAEVKTVAAASVSASNTMAQAFAKPAAPAKQAASGIAAAYQGLNEPFVAVTNRIGEVTDRFLTLKNAIVAGLFAEVIHEGVEVATQLESVQERMEAITGSTAAANRELSFASTTAHDLGTQLISTTESYQHLLAATQNTSLEGAKTREIFLGVSEAAKALQKSTGDTASIFETMIGLLNRGEASSRQFQLMIGRQLPGSLQLAAKAMGVTTEEFNRMLVKGEVVAEDLLPKFANELHKTFGEQAQSDAADLESNVTRLGDSFKNLIASITNNGKTGEFFSLLDKFVGGLAISFGNAQDAGDALELKIRDLDAQIEKLHRTPTQGPGGEGIGDFLPSKDEVDAQIALLEKQRAALARVQEQAQKIGLGGITSIGPKAPPPKYTTEQFQTVTDLSNSLDKQSQVLSAHARYGYQDAAAIDLLNAKFTLLGKGIKDIPDDVQKMLDKLAAARKAAAATDFATALTEDTKGLQIQIAAGDNATQAMARYRLELDATHKQLNAMDPVRQKLIRSYLDESAALSANNILLQLQHETAEFDIQAASIARANENLEDYHRNLALKQGGTNSNAEIEQAAADRKLAQNAAAIAQMQDELRLAGLSDVALNREQALRKLNSAATEEQKAKVEQLADAQYKQMNGFAAYAKRAFDDVDHARESTLEGFIDNLSDVLAKGKFSFRSFAESVLSDLARIYAKALITQAILAGISYFSVGGSGAMPAGGASSVPGAGGGPVTPGSVPAAEGSSATLSGQNYMVGEAGMEMVKFNRTAQILNNRDTRREIANQGRTPIGTNSGSQGGDIHVTVQQENTFVTQGVTAEEVQAQVSKGMDRAVRASVITVQSKWKNGRL